MGDLSDSMISSHLHNLPDYLLAAEMHRRGYSVYERDPLNVAPLHYMAPEAIIEYLSGEGYKVSRPVEPAPTEETDLDRWLEVWDQLDVSDQELEPQTAALDYLLAAVRNLVTLIQPPSVRVARQVSASSEDASQT